MVFRGAMLAHKFTGNEDITDYYMSEKLDGIRAFYLGKGKFVSRNNKPIYAPKWFTDKLPDIVIDGELFTRRGDFSNISSIVRKKIPIDSEWDNITYMVIDLPNTPGKFEARYNKAVDLFYTSNIAELIKQYPIKNNEEFDKLHKQLVKKGAEGTMLRRKCSMYEHKRSRVLLKVKDFFDDEVIVDGHEKGSGKYNDILGNLIVHWKQNSKKYKGNFNVGSGFTDYERKKYKTLYPVGTVVTIKYWELQPSGKPRFPIFMRIRD